MVTDMLRPGRNSEPYGITEVSLAGPELPGASEVLVCISTDIVLDRLAADLVAHGMECVRKFGDFHLALSGCAELEPLYRRLMYDPDFRKLPWGRTHLWIVDECCVGFDNPKSKYRTIYETIVQHADIPNEQVHPISAISASADSDYEKALCEQLEWREKGQDRLDFVMLSLGIDGSIAGLYPYSEAINEDHKLVRFNSGGQPPLPEIVTMTFPLINAARFIAVFAAGKPYTEAIHRLADGEESAQAFPITGIKPLAGALKWYMDADAADCADEVKIEFPSRLNAGKHLGEQNSGD